MEPETEALLRQCRTSLLLHSNEHVAALLAYWLEMMIGEESMDEEIDDLCLLLDYRVQSYGAPTSYATYTAWWEVEGYLDPGEGSFTCVDITSLRLRLLDMSLKQFAMVIELGYQVHSLLAEMDGEPKLLIGNEFLREMAEWLKQAAPPPERVKPAPRPPLPLPLPNETKEQRRAREQAMVAEADQQGYLVVTPEMKSGVKDFFRHACKIKKLPCIVIESMGPSLVRLSLDTKTIPLPGGDLPTPQLKEQFAALVAPALARARAEHYQAQLSWVSPRQAVLTGILAEDVHQLAQEIINLWATFVKELPPPPPPQPIIRFIPPDPPWKQAITRLQEQTQELPVLAETVVLPDKWEDLFTKEQLLAFLAFLGLPARAREMKAPLVQRLRERLEADPTARAQLFEVFVHELAVPPWELETLLGCTTSERKRWTEENKLTVLEYDSFRKGRTEISYPIFDRRVVLSITPADLAAWRAGHQALVKAHRSEGARAAAANRKAKQRGFVEMTD